MKTTALYAASLFLFVSACGPQKKIEQQETDPDAGPVTLKFGVHDDLSKFYQATIDTKAFKDKFPQLTVEFVDTHSEDDAVAHMKECVQNDTCYDIDSMPTGRMLLATKQGADVVDMHAAPHNQTLSVFGESAKPLHSGPHGEIYGLPVDAAPIANYYRLDLITDAVQRYNADHPSAQFAAASEEDIIALMNNLTWDDYIDLLAPYLLSNASSVNDGHYSFPMATLNELDQAMLNTSGAPGWVADGELDPTFTPYLRKHIELTRRLVLGKNSGALTSGYDASQSYLASHQPPYFKTLSAASRPCQIVFDAADFEYKDVIGQWSFLWTCIINEGDLAVWPFASWGRSYVLEGVTWGTPAPAPRDDFKAWGTGKFRVGKTFGLKKGNLLPQDVAHATGAAGGTSLVVPKTTKHPKIAVAVAAFLATQVEPQLTQYQIGGAFPTLKAAQLDSRFTVGDPDFGGQVVSGILADAVNNSGMLGDHVRRVSTYDDILNSAYQDSVRSHINFGQDISDANAAQLADEILADLAAAFAAAKR